MSSPMVGVGVMRAPMLYNVLSMPFMFESMFALITGVGDNPNVGATHVTTKVGTIWETSYSGSIDV